jgi:hypothetical protein
MIIKLLDTSLQISYYTRELNTLKLIIILYGKKIQSKEIEAPYVKSEDQFAGAFTKGLDLKLFRRNIDKLGMIDPYSPLI